MEFTDGDILRPVENIILYDDEDEESYIYVNYLVFYDGEEVYATRTLNWYFVSKVTGEVTSVK